MFVTDVSNDQYVEEMETAAYESRTDESLLIQQMPTSRGRLGARMDSVQVYNAASYYLPLTATSVMCLVICACQKCLAFTVLLY